MSCRYLTAAKYGTPTWSGLSCAVWKKWNIKYTKHGTNNVGRKKFSFLHVPFLFHICRHLWSGERSWQTQGTRECCLPVSELLVPSWSAIWVESGASGRWNLAGGRKCIAGTQAMRLRAGSPSSHHAFPTMSWKSLNCEPR